MEQILNLNQIFMPNRNDKNTYTDYQKKLQPKMDFESEVFRELYNKHKEELLSITIKECEAYLSEDDWKDEDTFPCVYDLTGDWYLAFVSVSETNGTIDASLYLHFLGYYKKGTARGEIDDYLGMEAWFAYDPACDTFVFDGLNTDSI